MTEKENVVWLGGNTTKIFQHLTTILITLTIKIFYHLTQNLVTLTLKIGKQIWSQRLKQIFQHLAQDLVTLTNINIWANTRPCIHLNLLKAWSWFPCLVHLTLLNLFKDNFPKFYLQLIALVISCILWILGNFKSYNLNFYFV